MVRRFSTNGSACSCWCGRIDGTVILQIRNCVKNVLPGGGIDGVPTAFTDTRTVNRQEIHKVALTRGLRSELTQNQCVDRSREFINRCWSKCGAFYLNQNIEPRKNNRQIHLT